MHERVEPVRSNKFSMAIEDRIVSGFAGVDRFRVRVAEVTDARDVEQVVTHARKNGHTLCPSGHGCSYGDQAIDDQGIVVDTMKMNKIISFDQEIGRITVQPGIQLVTLLREIVPFGWMLTALPGGLKITVGGAVANNVHGKDCWTQGNFAANVVTLGIVSADGQERIVSRNDDAALFDCVLGGMGLLGIVTEVTLRLKPIPAPFLEVTTWPVAGLAEMGQFLRELDTQDEYAVGWLDCFARGNGFGRGSAETARWSKSKNLPEPGNIAELLQTHDKVLGFFPAAPTWWVLRHFFFHRSVKFANAAKYRAHALKKASEATVFFPQFLWMIDNLIPEFNRLLVPHGFASLQPLIPMDDNLEGLGSILRDCQQARFEPILCSIKRHRADDAPLSFSGAGVSFNIDIPLKGKDAVEVRTFIDGLYKKISDLNGKVYLAKDIYLAGAHLEQMYPNLKAFLACKSRHDPNNLFTSNMSRRLFSH
jgi:decaprenylphospho-beta-D-ribofuranose 2-oxidase